MGAWSRRIAAAGVVLVVVLAVLGCGADADEATDNHQSPSTLTRTQKPVTTARQPPAPKPAGFTGGFSTQDTRQRCKAAPNVVVCASTPSGQRVTLDRSGAHYQGEVATSFPAAAPLGVGNEITTVSGIHCLNSSRGIECTRGGHGFIIGDSAVVILKGAKEQRYEASTPEPAAPAVPSTPPPDGDLETVAPADATTAGQVCWPGMTIPETTIPAVHIPATTIPATTIGGVTYPEVRYPAVNYPARTLPGRTLPPTCFDSGDHLAPQDTSILIDGYESVDPDFSLDLSQTYWDSVPSVDVGSGYSGAFVPDVTAAGYGELNDAGFPRNQYVSSYYRRDGTHVEGYWRNSPSDGLPTCQIISC